MKHRIFVLITLIITIFSKTSFAAVLGEVSSSWSTDMGAGTYFHHTTFISDTVGNQRESYIEYKPNELSKPVIVNGNSIWGRRNIKNAVSYMEDMGLRTIGGINADYFSYTTGIPMGNVIINGKIMSKENLGQDALAFRKDGSAFIDWFDVKTTLSNGTKSVGVDCINKWYQKGYDTIFMLNSDFDDTTHTNSECIFIICSVTDGNLSVGQTQALEVEDNFIYDGEIKIPDGKVVLLMEKGGILECEEFLMSLKKGDKLTIRNDASDMDNNKWADVTEMVSSVGGRIIKNGVVQDVDDKQSAPRTAVGVKSDGSVIMYTLDGRQSGFSYGAKIQTIAKRLLELGCVEGINLDGGGSTTIGAVFPGNDEFLVMNSPSEGSLRNVANFLFIRDDRKRTNIPWVINVKEETEGDSYLSGAVNKIVAESVYDTSNYKIENPKVSYELINEGADTIKTDEGTYKFLGTGKTEIIISSEDAKVIKAYNVYEAPDSIKIFNKDDGKEIKAINTEANEELQLNLKATAYVDGKALIADDDSFLWEATEEIGKVNEDGIFTLKDTHNVEGKITVSAGGVKCEIPVKINDYPRINPFADTNTHWAKEILASLYEKGIIKGSDDNGVIKYYPDNYMTRAEFSSMMCNYMGIDISVYDDEVLVFRDSDTIPLWARNYVKAMFDKGIINGRTNADGTVSFCPDDVITRAEAMTILSRIIKGDTDGDLTFNDNNEIPDWATDAVKMLLNMGIINGYEDNTIRPNSNVSRAEAAVMLYKTDNS